MLDRWSRASGRGGGTRGNRHSLRRNSVRPATQQGRPDCQRGKNQDAGGGLARMGVPVLRAVALTAEAAAELHRVCQRESANCPQRRPAPPGSCHQEPYPYRNLRSLISNWWFVPFPVTHI